MVRLRSSSSGHMPVTEALDHIRTDAVIAPAEQRAEYLRGYQAYLQLYPHLKQTLHLLAQ